MACKTSVAYAWLFSRSLFLAICDKNKQGQLAIAMANFNLISHPVLKVEAKISNIFANRKTIILSKLIETVWLNTKCQHMYKREMGNKGGDGKVG